MEDEVDDAGLIQVTQGTYALVADRYATRREDRSALGADVRQFVSLVRPGGLVVDVGCGPGYDTAILRRHGLQAVGMDLSAAMMRAGRDRGVTVPLIQADMRALPFVTGLDGLWVGASLLHLPRRQVPATLRGFHHVLRPGGILYLTVKRGDGEGWRPGAYGREASRFFTYWQPDVLDHYLAEAGFQVVAGAMNEAEGVMWLTRLAQKERLRD